MAINVTTEPTVEPIPVEDLKNDIRVDSDLTEDDALINSFAVGARRWVEKTLSRALITQTIELTLDAWPATSTIEIPRPPLQSITSIKYYDDDDNPTTLSSDAYFVDTASSPGRVVLRTGESWPATTLRVANGVVIQFDAGYGDDEADVPDHAKQAIRFLVGHWYENREAVTASGAQPKEVPFGVMALLWPDRVVTF